MTDRLVVHLYTDADGNIGRTQAFFGMDERVAVYDYGNAETEAELIKGGTERLESLKDYKEMTMEVADVAADIGDIVGGREYTTGFLIRREITQKIIKIERGRIKTQYKVCLLYTSTDGYWTIQNDDLVVRGLVDDDIRQASDLLNKYPYVARVNSFSDNRRGNNPHFRIGGVS